MTKYAIRLSLVVSEVATDVNIAANQAVLDLRKWHPLSTQTIKVEGAKEFDNEKPLKDQEV